MFSNIISIKLILKNFLSYFFNINIYRTGNKDLYKFLKKIKVYNLGHTLIRIGSENDGGYLLPNILDQIDFCFSPGCGELTNFENDLKKIGIKCFIADYNISNNFIKKNRFNIIKKFINTHNDKKNITLSNWINSKLTKKKQKNLLLQMDIEGNEYKVLANCEESLLKCFKILVIEFHGLESIGNKISLKFIEDTFEKLLKNFYICHIHPNNNNELHQIGAFKVPSVLEITFLRSDLIKFKKKIRNIPNILDKPNLPEKKDLILPK